MRKAQRKNKGELLRIRTASIMSTSGIAAPRQEKERALSRVGGDIFRSKTVESGLSVQLLPEIHQSRLVSALILITISLLFEIGAMNSDAITCLI